MSSILNSGRAKWDLEIGNALCCIRDSEAIVSVAVVLRDACIKAPSGIGKTWIYWGGKGSLRIRPDYGTIVFSWEADDIFAQFEGVTDAVLKVSKIVGMRKARFKRAKKEGEQ